MSASKIWVLLVYISSFATIYNQEIPSDFKKYHFEIFNFDLGKNWEQNTTLGSPRFYKFYKDKIEKHHKDSLYISIRSGVSVLDRSMALYNFAHFSYQKYLYGYLYPKIVNNTEHIPGYSGVPRDRSRFGFNSGETVMSGIGFENNWLSFQLCRGKENWGANDEINLALSNNSSSYDYFMLSSDYKNIKVKYFHGFLESTKSNVNRYISARGIEWSNEKYLIIGLSEIIIYSGENRSLDFAYLNPMSSHLEVELNDRLNVIGEDGANAIWQFSFDYLLKKKLRISYNYIIDEIVLDQEQKRVGKENGDAYSIRLSYNPSEKLIIPSSLFLSVVSVGTPTFRHNNGFNNFIQRNKPLGWKYGSDTFEIKCGIKISNQRNLIFSGEYGYRLSGEESILNRPYEKYFDYIKDDFPSGDLVKNNFCSFKLNWWYKKNISFIINSSFIESNSSFLLGLNIYLPGNLII